jgi:hypothetical protein
MMGIYSQLAWAIGTINIQVALDHYGHKGLMKIQPINSPVIMAIQPINSPVIMAIQPIHSPVIMAIKDVAYSPVIMAIKD